MRFIPIGLTAEENKQFDDYPHCRDILLMSIEYYSKIGFVPPWICYFAMEDRKLVGSAGFKGKPVDGRVEIAYGTFEPYWRTGIGTRICRELVRIAIVAAPGVKIAARTVPDNLGSIGVLKKNGFRYVGVVHDDDDGEVCEWEYL